MIMNLLSTAVVSMSTITGTANAADPVPEPCIYLENASEAVEHCLRLACKVYYDAFDDCDTPVCRQLARIQHLLDALDCAPAVRFAETVNGMNDWIAFEYDGVSMTYTYVE